MSASLLDRIEACETVLGRFAAVEAQIAKLLGENTYLRDQIAPRLSRPKSVNLSGVEWRIVERIAQRAPNVVLNEELMALLPRSRDGSTLRVHVGKARKKLMPFDIVILSDHSLGYRMALADVEAIRGLG